LINKLDPDSFDRIARQNPGVARDLGPSLDSEFLWFNQAPSPEVPEWKRTWFRSAAFRHAVSRAIRRDDIARVAFRGHARPAAGPVSPANRFWFNDDLKALPSDEAGALRSLMAEGFRLRDGVLRDGAGHEVEFSIVTNAGNRPREAMAAVIQDDLKRIGIRVNIVTLDFNSLIDRIAKSSRYEACLLGFANVPMEPTEQMNMWLSSGAQHTWWPRQKSPATAWEARIDQLALKQASEVSRKDRKSAFDELQKIVVAEEPIIYLVNPNYLAAISPAVRDAKPVAAAPQVLWNAASISIR
jgi:peptide/nickel transport system substrate-binding protein